MAYEQRDMNGAIFKNTRREKDSHPNLTGTALVDGVEYYVSGWTKARDNGEKWISLSFKKKDGQAKAPAAPADLDDDIPF